MPNKTIKKKSLKLLALCQLFYPELVSTGQTLTELCEELADMGVDVEVLCAPPSIVKSKEKISKYLEYHGIHIKRVWATSFPKLNFIGRVVNQLSYAASVFFYLLFDRTKRPILVLTNPPFLAFFCALLRKFKLGNPYVYLIFDVYPDTAINLGVLKEDSFLSKLWAWVNKISFQYATKIIVIGRCMKDVIESKINKSGLKINNKVQMIHVWSDDRHIKAIKSEQNPFIEKWGLKGKFVILYSGNMGRFHDMETIMEVAKNMVDYKDIVFLFVGEGHKKAWVIDFIDRWRLSNCQVYSYVNREDLGYLLSCAHIGLVSLSLGQEGLSVPSKTFGLMAAGVPVIAVMSASSEIARVLTEEECGVVISHGDAEGLANAILSFYNNSQKLESMGKNARRAIDTKYNLRTAAKLYMDIIEEIDSKIYC